MGRGQTDTGADNILYGVTTARGAKAEARVLLPKEYWVDEIDYSIFRKFGTSYFQDHLGFSGWTFWGARSRTLPQDLRKQLRQNDTSPQVDQFVDKLIDMARSPEDLGEVEIRKAGSREWELYFEGLPNYRKRADTSFMTAIEQISATEGSWMWKDSEGLRHLLYLDCSDTEPQLLGWRLYAT